MRKDCRRARDDAGSAGRGAAAPTTGTGPFGPGMATIAGAVVVAVKHKLCAMAKNCFAHECAADQAARPRRQRRHRRMMDEHDAAESFASGLGQRFAERLSLNGVHHSRSP